MGHGFLLLSLPSPLWTWSGTNAMLSILWLWSWWATLTSTVFSVFLVLKYVFPPRNWWQRTSMQSTVVTWMGDIQLRYTLLLATTGWRWLNTFWNMALMSMQKIKGMPPPPSSPVHFFSFLRKHSFPSYFVPCLHSCFLCCEKNQIYDRWFYRHVLYSHAFCH